MSKTRSYVFFRWAENPGDLPDISKFKEALISISPRNFVFQLERSPLSGKYYYLGWIYFYYCRSPRWREDHALLRNIEYLPPRRTLADNYQLCTHPANRAMGPWEYGSLPQKEYPFIRLESITPPLSPPVKRKREGDNEEEEEDSEPSVEKKRAIKGSLMEIRKEAGLPLTNFVFDFIRDYKLPKRENNSRTEIWFFHGEKGTGKTMSALSLAGEDCYQPIRDDLGRLWWDNYQQEKYVLLDDFSWERIPIQFLKSLGDWGPLKVDRKSSVIEFNSKIVIITTTIPFFQWYPRISLASKTGLEWRVDLIAEFKKDALYPEIKKDIRMEKTPIPIVEYHLQQTPSTQENEWLF